MTDHKPLTRHQRLANMADMLGERVGKKLVVHSNNPGDGRRYQIDEEIDGNLGGHHYSPKLPIGEIETLLEFAIKVSYDAQRNA
jgi:hypothetical protein